MCVCVCVYVCLQYECFPGAVAPLTTCCPIMLDRGLVERTCCRCLCYTVWLPGSPLGTGNDKTHTHRHTHRHTHTDTHTSSSPCQHQPSVVPSGRNGKAANSCLCPHMCVELCCVNRNTSKHGNQTIHRCVFVFRSSALTLTECIGDSVCLSTAVLLLFHGERRWRKYLWPSSPLSNFYK